MVAARRARRAWRRRSIQGVLGVLGVHRRLAPAGRGRAGRAAHTVQPAPNGCRRRRVPARLGRRLPVAGPTHLTSVTNHSYQPYVSRVINR